MQEIDNTSCGDCLQEKIKLQQDWIGDLTEQNEMLVRAVEELEHEATERVKMLEEKLQKSAESICEAEKRNISQDSTIRMLEAKIEELDSVSMELKCKKEECETLQKNMIDMRQALTEEVATKHDAVLKLKRECQDLEDRCIQADKQTAFKDDIIKELRKEIKQLKQQMSLPEKPYQKNSNIISKSNSKGEHVLVINHTKKIVQSGKSTVVYLRHNKDETEKDQDKQPKTIVDEHIAECSRCRLKFENKITEKKEIESSLSFCKSESDLSNFNQNSPSPIKEKSKFTISEALSRRNTFIETSSNTLKDENALEFRNICVPNHIPVKTHINNLEFNKKK